MIEQQLEPSESLAAWLAEVGRRAAPAHILSRRAPESSEDLVRYLEQLAGTELRSREAIRRYIAEVAVQDRNANPVYKRRRFVKETALLVGLLAAYIHYYFWDVNLQIARLPHTLIFVPVDARSAPHGSSEHAGWSKAGKTGLISLSRTA